MKIDYSHTKWKFLGSWLPFMGEYGNYIVINLALAPPSKNKLVTKSCDDISTWKI